VHAQRLVVDKHLEVVSDGEHNGLQNSKWMVVQKTEQEHSTNNTTNTHTHKVQFPFPNHCCSVVALKKDTK